jgi:hypothetical protein
MPQKMPQIIKKRCKSLIYSALGDPDWIRTNDPQLRRLMLYPTELPDQFQLGSAKLMKLFVPEWLRRQAIF